MSGGSYSRGERCLTRLEGMNLVEDIKDVIVLRKVDKLLKILRRGSPIQFFIHSNSVFSTVMLQYIQREYSWFIICLISGNELQYPRWVPPDVINRTAAISALISKPHSTLQDLNLKRLLSLEIYFTFFVVSNRIKFFISYYNLSGWCHELRLE